MKVDPSVVLDLLERFRHSKTMFAAVGLVFDALRPGPMSLAGLKKTLNVDMDALQRLLDACVGLQSVALASRRGLSEHAGSKYLPMYG